MLGSSPKHILIYKHASLLTASEMDFAKQNPFPKISLIYCEGPLLAEFLV